MLTILQTFHVTRSQSPQSISLSRSSSIIGSGGVNNGISKSAGVVGEDEVDQSQIIQRLAEMDSLIDGVDIESDSSDTAASAPSTNDRSNVPARDISQSRLEEDTGEPQLAPTPSPLPLPLRASQSAEDTRITQPIRSERTDPVVNRDIASNGTYNEVTAKRNAIKTEPERSEPLKPDIDNVEPVVEETITAVSSAAVSRSSSIATDRVSGWLTCPSFYYLLYYYDRRIMICL